MLQRPSGPISELLLVIRMQFVAFRTEILDEPIVGAQTFFNRLPQSLHTFRIHHLIIHHRPHPFVHNMELVFEHSQNRFGNFMHHSDALHVVERYTPIGPYHLRYEATIEDPNVFTRPWTISMPLYRRIEEDVRLLEFKCVDLAEEYVYGGLVDASSR